MALAWVHAQPAVTSIIIGARRLSQFEDNIRALDVNLTAEDLARLNAITEPTFGFPQSMLPMVPGIHNGGTTVNGLSAPTTGFGIEKGDQPYGSREGTMTTISKDAQLITSINVFTVDPSNQSQLVELLTR